MRFVLLFDSSPFVMVGLSAAITYSRVRAHSMSRSGRLPIHTYEKPGTVRDSRVVLPRGAQAELTIPSSGLCALFCSLIHLRSLWLA